MVHERRKTVDRRIERLISKTLHTPFCRTRARYISSDTQMKIRTSLLVQRLNRTYASYNAACQEARDIASPRTSPPHYSCDRPAQFAGPFESSRRETAV